MTISIFRYPGAKTKLLPIILNNFKDLIKEDGNFIDAFVGGGSVLLAVAEKYSNIKLYANDKDYWIYSFWKVISDSNQENFEDFLDMVMQKPTIDFFYSLREDKYTDNVRCAYKALFFNRTTFSGILYSGPIGGKNQNSKYTVDCRYNIPKLRNNLIKCRNLLKGRTIVSNDDFSNFKMLTETNYPIYLDPPYYIVGNSLYFEKMTNQDHFDLSCLLFNRDNWVLSYDDCDEIKSLYKDWAKIIDINARYCITGTKNTWKDKNEIIIIP